MRSYLFVIALALLPVSTVQAENYRGEKISISAQSMQLHDFFLLIAELSGLNVVVHPDIHGTLTLHLKDVPWDQVLALVSHEKQLVPIREGNVLYIIPAGKVSTFFKRLSRK